MNLIYQIQIFYLISAICIGNKRDYELTISGYSHHLIYLMLDKIFVAIASSLKEQTAIANALSDVDALITSLEKLITKKRAIKTAAMQQLLTGKKRLPPFDLTHTGYKHTELGEIPEDWEVGRAFSGCGQCLVIEKLISHLHRITSMSHAQILQMTTS